VGKQIPDDWVERKCQRLTRRPELAAFGLLGRLLDRLLGRFGWDRPRLDCPRWFWKRCVYPINTRLSLTTIASNRASTGCSYNGSPSP